jgi:hypothetical protein
MPLVPTIHGDALEQGRFWTPTSGAWNNAAMAKPSPLSVAFDDAFNTSLLPILRTVGLTSTKAKNVKPGLLVALATRPLLEGKRLEVCLWCDRLRLRVDVIRIVNEVECSEQIDLRVPWTDTNSPTPVSLDFSGNQFLPAQNTEQLQRAIAFLAGAFAGASGALAAALPELAEELHTASTDATWVDAKEQAANLWRNRHTRGEVDDRSCPATVVFVGANLVVVTADGERLTFRFDTNTFDRTASLSVSGWIVTPAGTRRATRFTAGRTTWHFDPAGSLAEITEAGPSA